RDQVVFVVEGNRREDRTEDLLARDLHLSVDLREYRGLDEITVRQLTARALPTGRDLRAFLLTRVDVAEHPLQLLLGHKRTHLRHGVDAWSEKELIGGGRDAVEHVVVHLLLHEQPRARR